MKKRKIAQAEIPTASMADIAFLLLLFFLVATVIDVDTGIGLTLPEYIPPEEIEEVKVDKERMAAILINANGDVLLDGNRIPVFQIKENLKPRLKQRIEVPANQKLIVSIKTDRETDYNTYIQALDQAKLAFFEVRDAYSLGQYGEEYDDLAAERQEIVQEKIPIIISLAEPEAVKK